MSLLINYKKYKIIAGCDEAGRGCLAGPVVAAAVILSKPIKGLNDSKKLSKKQRNDLKSQIEENALCFAVSFIDNVIIDKINILNASIEAMHLSLNKLSVVPEIILVDGNRFKPYKNILHQTVIKGDGKYQCIAAASILAKTYRDEYMENMHEQFPHYGWKNNVGYPTKAHRTAIETFGSCTLHRKTFRLLAEKKLKIDL